MSNDAKVKMTLEAEGAKAPESSALTPSLGALVEIGFGNAETTWRLDYRKPDTLRLRIDGSIRLVETRKVEVEAGGRLTRDLFKGETTLKGSLEMEFNENVDVEITGSSGPGGSYVGAGLTIEF